MSNYNIEVVKGGWWKQKWRVRLVSADNGKTVLSGETLKNHNDAVEVAQNIAAGTFIVFDNN